MQICVEKYCIVLLLACLHLLPTLTAQEKTLPNFKKNMLLDSIVLSDPFILADQKTNLYYMTGSGGLLWKSLDLKFWDGPYKVTATDPTSWMGPAPMIWAAEIHPLKTGITILPLSPTGL